MANVSSSLSGIGLYPIVDLLWVELGPPLKGRQSSLCVDFWGGNHGGGFPLQTRALPQRKRVAKNHCILPCKVLLPFASPIESRQNS